MPSLLASLGGLIGGKVSGKEGKADPQFTALQPIERAQRDTIHAIQQQTTDLPKPENRSFNLPASFNVPSYRPQTAGPSYYDNSNVNLTVNVEASRADLTPDPFRNAVVDALGRHLDSSRKNRPFGTTYMRYIYAQ